MDIGTGIAIAGVWMFVGACAISKTVSGTGLATAFLIAISMTIYLA